MLALRALRHAVRARVLQLAFAALMLFVLLDFTGLFDHTRSTPADISSYTSNGQKIFISSTHWNNEHILKSHWNQAIIDLIYHLGSENVYISVLESGSWDNSKDALRELDRRLSDLNVNRTIILDETTHLDEIQKMTSDEVGWVDTPRGKKELRRIPFLSRLRNKTLEPLKKLVVAGQRFDRIIFLNDVVFSTADVMTLLHTRDGNYSAVCSLDFKDPPRYYDTFALRDINGKAGFSEYYPIFGSRVSRKAFVSKHPVPVKSCWNGIAIFDAEPFAMIENPIRFRGIPDSLAKYHLEGSECCLIHYDNPLTALKGVWLNPNVKVGYNGDAYDAVRQWPSFGEGIRGTWKGILASLLSLPWRKNSIAKRVKKWEQEVEENDESGFDCLVDEMQVLVYNGWAHV